MASVIQLIEEGIQHLENSQFDEAEIKFMAALKLDPGNLDALCNLGWIKSKNKDYEKGLELAREICKIDPAHRDGLFILANCLYWLGHYTEGLDAMLKFAPAEEEITPFAQLGLLYEKAGRFAEAEKVFRIVLEQTSRSYGTRMAAIAMHDKSPFVADMLHALARVMQQQGDRKEAWLYYHLAKRNDPLFDLDPMYQQILTVQEIENHPWFDYQESVRPPEDSDFKDIMIFLFEQDEYHNLKTEVLHYGMDKKNREIVTLIHHSQKEGMFFSSARLRLVGDLAQGSDAEELFQYLHSIPARQLFEVAEKLFAKEIDDRQAMIIAGRLESLPEKIDTISFLIWRFIRIHPETGIIVARVFAESVRHKGHELSIAIASSLLGECYYRLKKYQEAKQHLGIACGIFSRSGVATNAENAFQYYCSVLIGFGQKKEAMQQAQAYVHAAESTNDQDNLVPALILFTDMLRINGDKNAALEILRRAEDISIKHEIKENYKRNIKALVSELSGDPELKKINSDDHDTDPITSEDHLQILKNEAEDKINKDDIAGGCELLEKAATIALDQVRIQEAVFIYYKLGQNRSRLRLLEKAAEDLQTAISFGEPLSHEINLWPIHLDLGYCYKEQSKYKEAIECFENGLKEARRKHSIQGQRFCHRALAEAISDEDAERSEYHKKALQSPDYENEEIPELETSMDLVDQERYTEAIPILHDLINSNAGNFHSKATIQSLLGLCYLELGRVEAAKEWYYSAAEIFENNNFPDEAVQMYFRLIQSFRDNNIENIEQYAKVSNLIDRLTDHNQKSICLSFASEAAYNDEKFTIAENWAKEGIRVTEGETAKNLSGEIQFRSILGRVSRIQCKYKDSKIQYELGIKIAIRIKDEPFEGLLRGWKAVAHKYLREVKESINEYKEAIRIADYYHENSDAAQHRFNMAQVLLVVGENEEALNCVLLSLRSCNDFMIDRLAKRVVECILENWDISVVPQDLHDYFNQFLDRANPKAGQDVLPQAISLSKEAQRLIKNNEVEEGIKAFDRSILLLEGIGDKYNVGVNLLKRAFLLKEIAPDQAMRDVHVCKELSIAQGLKRMTLTCNEYILKQSLFTVNGIDEFILMEVLNGWEDLRMDFNEDDYKISFANDMVPIAELCMSHFLTRSQPGKALELSEYTRALALSDLIGRPEMSDNKATQHDIVTELDRILGTESIVISFTYLTHEVLVFIYRKGWDNPVARFLPLDKKAIADLVSTFQYEMYQLKGKSINTWLEKAKQLSAFIMEFIKKNDHVIFILEEELEYIPFACLPVGENEHLCDHISISYAPSIRVLAQLKERDQSSKNKGRIEMLSIGVAFPDEALAISDIISGITYTGNNLPKDEVRKMLMDKKNVIHFACHGFYDKRSPDLSGLFLTSPNSPLLTHQLSVKDLSDWKFGSNLVVLSACETGIGTPEISEFTGLPRSFLAAGSNAVIATLWPVHSLESRKFMLSFYTKIAKAVEDSGEINISQALNDTQREMSKGNNIYHWAAYKLIGWPIFNVKPEI